MTKFADECRHVMQCQLHNLAMRLGPKTMELQLRIGLHSGPVTAGVLRGDKARFQLFGDSMNTASRYGNVTSVLGLSPRCDIHSNLLFLSIVEWKR